MESRDGVEYGLHLDGVEYGLHYMCIFTYNGDLTENTHIIGDLTENTHIMEI